MISWEKLLIVERISKLFLVRLTKHQHVREVFKQNKKESIVENKKDRKLRRTMIAHEIKRPPHHTHTHR